VRVYAVVLIDDETQREGYIYRRRK